MNSIQMMTIPVNDYACSEAINTLCTNITFTGENIRKIMVTSCHANEGKSFISMNTAFTMAKIGKKVVFVDTDLRKSIINQRYKIKFPDDTEKTGLTHYLAGMAKADDILYSTNIAGVYIVPVGRRVSNSLSLISTERFDQLLDKLAQTFDYVIVDAPPIGALIDGAQIAKSCDGTLLVVNYNSVHRQELINAKQQLEQTGCPILGVVLNEVDYDNYLGRNYYYKSYYSHYDSYYYSRESKSKKK